MPRSLHPCSQPPRSAPPSNEERAKSVAAAATCAVIGAASQRAGNLTEAACRRW